MGWNRAKFHFSFARFFAFALRTFALAAAVFLAQRDKAAFLADSVRCSGVRRAARAAPPFRPSATAAASFADVVVVRFGMTSHIMRSATHNCQGQAGPPADEATAGRPLLRITGQLPRSPTPTGARGPPELGEPKEAAVMITNVSTRAIFRTTDAEAAADCML